MNKKDQLIKNNYSLPINNCPLLVQRILATAREKQAMFWQDQNACFGYPQKVSIHFVHRCMARPTIDTKEKRKARFTFRMTEREEEMLIQLMRYSNQSGAEVIRDIVFKERLLQPKIPVLDQKTYGELKRIGNNLNQVAKKLNANATAPEIEKTIKELKITINQILNKLLHDR
jgi:hypothetical protein